MPEPTPLPLPSSLRTLGLVGLATAGVLVVKWWKRRSQQPAAVEPRRTVAKVIDSRPVIDARVARRCAARDLPWVDVP